MSLLWVTKKEIIKEELKDESLYSVQEIQKGTGHAVMSAVEHIENYEGNVVIVYGDNPLLSPETIKKMVSSVENKNLTGTLLTIKLEAPPVAGRIIRDTKGQFIKVIEEQDCNEEQKRIKEINCGTYCFNSKSLVRALKKLSPDNNQNEYYLTDVPEIIVQEKGSIETVEAEDIFEILGVNNQEHRKFAEAAAKIKYAESLYDLIDASIALGDSK